MSYKLPPKKEYVDGNVKRHYEIENRLSCLEEAVRWLKLALRHGQYSRELRALCELAEANKRRAVSEWIFVNDSLIKAQGFMWEHFKQEEDKNAQAGGDINNDH